MATSSASRRKAASNRKPDPPQASDSTDTPVLDAALEQWSDLTARELAAWGLEATASLWRGVQALQQAQLDAAREAAQLHAQAAAEAQSSNSVADLARLQLSLAQSDGQVALHSWSKFGEVASRQAIEALSDTATGWAHWNNAAWAGALQWMGQLARQPGSAERVEAEVEHVVNPIAASPTVWPAQEAARQAITLASSAWNDWLAWSNRVADAGRTAADDAAAATR